MNWLEVSVEASHEASEAAYAVMSQYAAGGVAIEEPVSQPSDGDGAAIDFSRPVTLRAYLAMDGAEDGLARSIEEGLWHLSRIDIAGVGEVSVRELAEEDWANAWKDHYHVRHIGRRLVIKPSWRDYAPAAGEVVLELDPGMAFGTGLHPTTRLCLVAVEDLVKPGMRVLDVGAGSGILSIAAARLGALDVSAVEIDPVAAGVCQENVNRNHVADVVDVRAGTLESEPMPDERVDLILANITIATLLQLHPLFNAYLRPGGHAVVSGVLAERADELRQALDAAGWEHERTDQEQDWVAIYVRR